MRKHDYRWPAEAGDLATRLRFPALRTMVAQGLASVVKRDGKILLCLSQGGSPTAIDGMQAVGRGPAIDIGTVGFTENDTDSSCTYSKELPPDGGPYELVGTTTGWKPKATSSTAAASSREADVSGSTLHVFTVGIDKYVRDQTYPPLQFPVADANAIEQFFQHEKDGGGKPFASVRIWKGLRDETATREAIRAELDDMAKEVSEDDVALLFFSGHGRVPPGQEMFYYIPYLPSEPASSPIVDPIEEREVGLNTAMLAEAIRHLKARRVILVVDACQSGGAVESLAKIGDVKLSVEQHRADQEKASGRTGHAHDVGVYIMAAATPVQEALEPRPGTTKDQRKYGLLTTALLQALTANDSASANGEIWISTVFDSVKKNLPKLADQFHSVQTAFPVEVGSDFPIASR